MRMHRSGAQWVVETPAKLNLFFEVLAKRDDGYHEIETLMCPITLYDTLYFREEPSGQIDLKCDWAFGASASDGNELDALPQGRDNLAVQAVALLRDRTGVRGGAALRLVKRIPVAAGLGLLLVALIWALFTGVYARRSELAAVTLVHLGIICILPLSIITHLPLDAEKAEGATLWSCLREYCWSEKVEQLNLALLREPDDPWVATALALHKVHDGLGETESLRRASRQLMGSAWIPGVPSPPYAATYRSCTPCPFVPTASRTRESSTPPGNPSSPPSVPYPTLPRPTGGSP